MSRAYTIQISESLSRVVHVADGVQTRLELLALLPADRMAALLAAELAARGFVVEGGRAVRTDDDGLEVVVDLEAGTVTVSLTEDRQVDVSGTRNVTPGAEATGKERLTHALETEVEARREDARQALTARLEQRLRDLREELDQVTNRVTAEALKQRAAQLGEIEEITEGEDGSMTIRVRV